MDADKEEKLKHNTTEQTEPIIRDGHTTKYENNDVDSYGGAAVRDYSVTHARSPQILHISMGSYQVLVEEMREKDSYEFRYWTTPLIEGFSYPKQEYLVTNVNWRIKGLIRQIKKGGGFPKV